jgi:hypothetical protein
MRTGRLPITAAALFCIAQALALPVAGQRPDAKAVSAASALKAKGEAPDKVALTLQRDFRLDEVGVTATMAAARYDGSEMVAALTRAFRADLPRAASTMKQAGYPLDAVVRGLRAWPTATDRSVVDAIRMADFEIKDVKFAAVRILGISALDWTRDLYEAGVSSLEAGADLKDAYDLDGTEGARIMLDAGYRGIPVAEALRLVWQVDAASALQIFIDVEFTPVSYMSNEWPRWRLLETAGYEMFAPTIAEYSIAEYRPGLSGRLENVGVLDRSKISATPDPTDGDVEVTVLHAGLDNLVATIGGVAGQILERSPTTVQYYGQSYDSEVLRIRFQDFPTGNLRINRLGRVSNKPATALGYHVIEHQMFGDPLGTMSVVLGDPVGSGSSTIEGNTTEFEISTHRGNGLDIDVNDLRSTTVAVNTVAGSAPATATLRIAIDFETAGAEVEGTFLDYVPCWSCGSFKVPQSTCGSLSINCIIGFIGGTLTSLATCTNPDNWVESEMASGPALPFQADLTSPRLDIDIVLGADPATGGFRAVNVVGDFTAGISLRTTFGGIDLAAIEQWILTDVNERLQESLEELDLGAEVAGPLNTLRSILGWGTVRGVYMLSGGRLFVDSGY